MSDTATETVRDTLEKAFDSATEAPAPERPSARAERAPPPPRADAAPNDEKPPSEPVEAAEGEERELPPGERPRDQFGRFMSATPEGPKPDAETQTAEPQQITEEPETGDEAPDHTPVTSAPRSFSEAAQKAWASVDPALRDAVTRREAEMSRGAEQWAQQRRDLEPIAQAISQYGNDFAMEGVHPAAAVQQALYFRAMLRRDPVGAIAELARSSGVDLRQYAIAYDQATRAQQPQDPQLRPLYDKLTQLEGYVQQQEQAKQAQAQAERAQKLVEVNHDIQAFEADTAAHPYFASVRPAMAQLMQQGICQTLQHAYEVACWGIPEIRAQLLRQQKQAEIAQRTRSEREAAERARRAGVSVSGAPSTTNGAVRKQGSGSVRDTLSQVYDAMVSR